MSLRKDFTLLDLGIDEQQLVNDHGVCYAHTQCAAGTLAADAEGAHEDGAEHTEAKAKVAFDWSIFGKILKKLSDAMHIPLIYDNIPKLIAAIQASALNPVMKMLLVLALESLTKDTAPVVFSEVRNVDGPATEPREDFPRDHSTSPSPDVVHETSAGLGERDKK